jgi:hypothetical protein
MKTHMSMADILRDWPAFLNNIFYKDLSEGDFFDRSASGPLDRRLATLGRILANPKTRHAATLVVSCPQGDPMLRVYLVEGEPMFVPARTLRFGLSRSEIEDSEGALGVDWAVFQIRRRVAQTEYAVRAQCNHRYRRIPRQWVLDRLEEGRHSAVFAD